MGIFGGPSGDKVLAKGSPSMGRITGIDVNYVSDENSDRRVDQYRVEHAAGVAGVRQILKPDVVVRLGMEVAIVVADGAAIIDWAATGRAQGFDGTTETYRYKALKDPPVAGISDTERRLESARKKGEQVVLTITKVAERAFFFGMGQVTDLTATVTLAGTEPFEAVLKRIEVPFYATHLVTVGRTMPGFVKLRRLDKPVIDWPTAAMASPGVGLPPALVATEQAPAEALGAGPDGTIDVRAAVDAAATAGYAFGGIDLATYVAVEVGLIEDRVPPAEYDTYASQRGVPLGGWKAADDAWIAAMQSDWRIGAAHGEAFSAEQKRQKR